MFPPPIETLTAATTCCDFKGQVILVSDPLLSDGTGLLDHIAPEMISPPHTEQRYSKSVGLYVLQ